MIYIAQNRKITIENDAIYDILAIIKSIEVIKTNIKKGWRTKVYCTNFYIIKMKYHSKRWFFTSYAQRLLKKELDPNPIRKKRLQSESESQSEFLTGFGFRS